MGGDLSLGESGGDKDHPLVGCRGEGGEPCPGHPLVLHGGVQTGGTPLDEPPVVMWRGVAVPPLDQCLVFRRPGADPPLGSASSFQVAAGRLSSPVFWP